MTKMIAILSLMLISSTVFADVKAISTLIEKAMLTNIFFWGETHAIPQQFEILNGFIAKANKEEVFDVIATEAVLVENNNLFQAYLTDPTANAGSLTEKKFFAKLLKNKIAWPTHEFSREFFRRLRLYKIAHPNTKICGIDRLPSLYSSLDYRKNLLAGISSELKTKMLKFFRTTEIEIVSEVFKNVFNDALREVGMAQAAISCINGSKRSFIHAGSYHTRNPMLINKSGKEHWIPLTGYIFDQFPSEKFYTLNNTLIFIDSDPFRQLSSKLGLNQHVQVLSAQELQTYSELLRETRIDSKTNEIYDKSLLEWDLYILGPRSGTSDSAP